jgi:superfamily II DNA helicase RecQ
MSALSVLVATPFGLFCQQCQKPVSKEYIRRHLLQNHGVTARAVELEQMEQWVTRQAMVNPDPFLSGQPYKQLQCDVCETTFSLRTNAVRHVKRSKCVCTLDNIKTTIVQNTCCGRVVSLSAIRKLNQGKTAVIPLSMKQASSILAPYVSEDEAPTSYTVMFLPMMVRGVDFECKIKELLHWSEDPFEDPRHEVLVGVAKLWLEDYVRIHVAMVPGNIRHDVLTYEATAHGGVEQRATFNMRMNNGPLFVELKGLLNFLCRHPSSHARMNEFLNELVNYNEVDVSPYIQSSLIPRIIMEYTFEEPNTLGEHPLIYLCAVTRCFRLLRDNKAVLNKAQGNGSRLSTVLHMTRAAVISYIALLQTDNYAEVAKNIARRSQSSRVSNLLGPAIRKMRELHDAKPTISNNTITSTFDIKVDSFSFGYGIWTSLIPRLTSIAYDLFNQIFVGVDWKNILENEIIMVQATGGVTITTAENIQSDAILLADCDLLILDRLTALVELSLHGLGCGAMRKEELSRVLNHQVDFRHGSFYYYSQNCKAPHVYSKVSELIEHKLPKVLGRVALLYRTVIQRKLPDCDLSFVRYRPDRQYWMVDLVRELFGLYSTPTALQVRHMWTGITNVIFPSVQNNVIVATNDVAEMSGHSAETHRAFYGSAIEGGTREGTYEKYHRALGELQSSSTGKNMGLHRLSIENISNALQLLFGNRACFRSDEQKQLILLSANTTLRHTVVSLGCGSGKSCAWIVPTYCRLLHGLPTGLSFVVLPYKFLVETLYNSACKMFGSQSNRIAKLENGVDEEVPPAVLCSDATSLPSLIFISIDAMNSLVLNHFGILERLSERKVLARLYLDEVHSMISENGYRQAYDCLPRLVGLGVPIMTLSGSLPMALSGNLHRYLGLTRDCQMSDVDRIWGGDPIGDGFTLTCQKTVFPPVAAVNAVMKHFNSSSAAVHVICATKDWASKVHGAMINKQIDSREVTSDVLSDNQDEIAREWGASKFSVLVSTTAALVGNENIACRLIVIVGLLYDVSQIVQAIGRLRKEQRDESAAVRLFYKVPGDSELDKWKDEHSRCFQSLRCKGMVSIECAKEFAMAFSRQAVFDWAKQTDICYIVKLRELLGAQGGEICKRCGNCRVATVISQQSCIAVAIKTISTSKKETATKLLLVLEEKCGVCSSRSCDGESCMQSNGLICFKCGGKHYTSVCVFSIASILQNKACYYCYDLHSRSNNHDKKSCRLKRRLKIAMMKHHWSLRSTDTYESFLRTVYASDEAWYNAIAGFKIYVVNQHNVKGLPKIGDIVPLELKAIQVSDDNVKSPLLPPSFCHQSRDLGQDPEYAITAQPSQVDSVSYVNSSEARSMYQFLQNESKSRLTRRRYVFGFVYKLLFPGFFLIDPMKQKVILDVSLEGTSATTKVVTDHIDNIEVLDAVLELGKRLPKKGNGRVDKGDVGDMFGLGIRDSKTKIVYKPTHDLVEEMNNVSQLVGPWLAMTHPNLAQDIENAERKKGLCKKYPMGGGPGSSIMISRNLGNASHLDVTDASTSVSIWAEEVRDRAKNWYFVLPNASYKGSRGVVVRLSHGTVIAWDGRVIRHCTSVTDVGQNNNVYGCMFGSCR